MGIATTAWFLIRVIPKPQRAFYPCMRAAAPVMSGFFIYLFTLGGSVVFFKRAFSKFKRGHYFTAAFSIIICLVLLVAFNINEAERLVASTGIVSWTRGVLPDGSNNPMGSGLGVYSGRVAWVMDKDATNENCTNILTDAFFMAKNNSQSTIDKMTDDGIKVIGGKGSVKDSWSAIFKSFNLKKTGTASDYTPNQTIFIKINNGQAIWAINYSDLSEKGNTSSTGIRNAAIAETTPATVLAFVRQLVDSCNVPQNKIYIADPMGHVYKSTSSIVLAKYPNVKILDKDNYTNLGRTTTAGWVNDVIVYSDKGTVMPDGIKDAIMKEMNDADYQINIAALKAHARAGMTLTAKQHFGTHGNHPGGYGFGSPYLHSGLICTVSNDVMTSGVRGEYKSYRVLTDLMGHEKLGGNTVLFVVDGLWGGIESVDTAVKWKTAPFNYDWPSSLFISQDAVALESVCLDFLRAEAKVNPAFKDRPFFPAIDDHLHQAADKANWPSGLTYDPEGDGTSMPSLGIHEHWNDDNNRQYSKNLSIAGTGIELVSIPSDLVKYNYTLPTAVSSLSNSVECRVYPNPCTNRATVSCQLGEQSIVKIDLISTNGQVVKQYRKSQAPAGNYRKVLDLSGLKSGLYLCSIQVNNQVKTIKLEIQ